MVGGLWAVCLASARSVEDVNIVSKASADLSDPCLGALSEASLCRRDATFSGSSGPGVVGRRPDIIFFFHSFLWFQATESEIAVGHLPVLSGTDYSSPPYSLG